MEDKIDVGVLLKNISDAIETSANLELSDFGLTVSQYRYLEYIDSCDSGVSAKDIREKFKVSQPTVAGILKRMRTKGYVRAEISKGDERTKDVFITAEGRKIVNQAASHKEKTEKRILECLSAEEQETVQALLRKIYDSFYGTESNVGGV